MLWKNLNVHQWMYGWGSCGVYIYNRILLNWFFKKGNPSICNNVDGPWKDHAKWEKSDKHRYFVMSLTCGIKKKTHRKRYQTRGEWRQGVGAEGTGEGGQRVQTSSIRYMRTGVGRNREHRGAAHPAEGGRGAQGVGPERRQHRQKSLFFFFFSFYSIYWIWMLAEHVLIISQCMSIKPSSCTSGSNTLMHVTHCARELGSTHPRDQTEGPKVRLCTVNQHLTRDAEYSVKEKQPLQ